LKQTHARLDGVEKALERSRLDAERERQAREAAATEPGPRDEGPSRPKKKSPRSPPPLAPSRPPASDGRERADKGTLNINSVPASEVILDGRPLGKTPHVGVVVSPGTHTVIFVTKESRTSRSVTVEAGRTATVAARL
jgi:serine/threonine-protein kinase